MLVGVPLVSVSLAWLCVLALGGFLDSMAVLPKTYESQATVLLLASRAESSFYGGNPYLGFSPSLALTADAVSRALMSPAWARQLAARGYGASYSVEPATYSTPTTGSVLVVTTTGSDKLDVQESLKAVMSGLRAELGVIQGKVRPRDRIQVTTLSISPQATLSVGHTARPLVALGAFALLAALGIPVLVERRAQRLSGREISEPGRLTPSPMPPAPRESLYR